MSAVLASGYHRDLIGYGANPPHPQWPGGARIAVNFVMNYEEGSEYSFLDGDGRSEASLTESPSSPVASGTRDLAGEGMFEYGSRVGFWRIMRLFRERNLPLTVFACALAWFVRHGGFTSAREDTPYTRPRTTGDPASPASPTSPKPQDEPVDVRTDD